MIIRTFSVIAALSAMLICPTSFAATSIGDTDTAAAGITTSGGHQFFGQTFKVPGSESGISSASLVIRRTATGVSDGSIQIYNYDEGTNSFAGGPLYSTPISVPLGENQLFNVTPNLPVTAGATMALVANWNLASPGDIGSYYRSTYYDDGHFILASGGAPFIPSNSDLAFQIQFGPIPEPGSMLALLTIAPLLTRPRRRS